jgi:hypothetical protein
MSPTTWAMIAYAIAAGLALIFLFFSGSKAWYWHVLSGLAALGIGLIPIPPRYNITVVNIAVGFAFVFMFVWAVASPFIGRRRRSA